MQVISNTLCNSFTEWYNLIRFQKPPQFGQKSTTLNVTVLFSYLFSKEDIVSRRHRVHFGDKCDYHDCISTHEMLFAVFFFSKWKCEIRAHKLLCCSYGNITWSGYTTNRSIIHFKLISSECSVIHLCII